MATTITVAVVVSMGHRLPEYDGNCSSPHGHNMKIEVEVETEPTFLDFKQVKKILQLLTDRFDHAMLLWEDDPLLPVLQEFGFRTFKTTEHPTTEYVARRVHHHMFGHGYKIKRTTVFETDKYSATVRA